MIVGPRFLWGSLVISGAFIFLFQNCGPAQLQSDAVPVESSGVLDQGSSSDEEAGSPSPQISPTPVVGATPAVTPTPILTPTPAAPAPVVRFSENSLDFGRVLIGAYYRRVIRVYNDGKANLVFDSIRITQSGFIFEIYEDVFASYCRDQLAPRTSCTISVDFSPNSSGTSVGTLNVITNAQPSQNTLPLSGIGVFL